MTSTPRLYHGNDTQETTESVLPRYAYDLYGIGGGQEDDELT